MGALKGFYPFTFLFSHMRRLMFGTFVVSLAMGMVNLAVPLYASELGATYTEIGLLGVTYILFYVFLCVPAGRWGDSRGKSPFVVAGFAGTAAVFILYHFSFTVPALLALRLFQGAMEAFIWTNLQGMVADASHPSGRGLAMGKYGAAWALGFGLGPLIAGFLYSPIGAREIFTVGGFIAALATFMVVGPSGSGFCGKEKTDLRGIFGPTVAGLLYIGMVSVVLILLPPYAKAVLGLSEFDVGFLIAIFTVLRAAFFIPFGAVSDRIGARVAMLSGLTAASVFCLGVGAAHDFLALLLALVGLAVSIGLVYPSLMSAVSKAAGRSTGYVMGIFNSISGLGWALFPGAGGALADVFSPEAPFIMCAVVGAALVVILAAAWRRRE